MTQGEIREGFLEVFGALFPEAGPGPLARSLALDSLQYRELAAGVTILREGQVCASAPFVVEGSIRVYKTSESGREITLYRIERGQTCILSAGCGSGIAAFPATVVTEKPTAAAFMPIALVHLLLDGNAAFRDFVFSQYSRRMADVIELVEEVAFRHVDERLRQWLVESAAPSPDRSIAATHQEIADHLGTSREVVSRILKDWENRGLVEISRGGINLLSAIGKPL